MLEYGFNFSPGDKTHHVILGLLESFSPAQIYMFIWRAVKDAAAYFVRAPTNRNRAANSAIGRIQRQAERAIAENWQIKSFRRDRRAPISMVGHVLYRAALRLEDDGIYYIPRPIAGDSRDYEEDD